MAMTAPFAPLYNGSTGLDPSITVAATASSTTSTAFVANLQQQQAFNQVRVCNTTSSFAYVNFGPLATVAAAAVATSLPIAPNSIEVFTIDPTANAATVILASGTGNVIFTRGEGI
jgi:hypothetical protein